MRPSRRAQATHKISSRPCFPGWWSSHGEHGGAVTRSAAKSRSARSGAPADRADPYGQPMPTTGRQELLVVSAGLWRWTPGRMRSWNRPPSPAGQCPEAGSRPEPPRTAAAVHRTPSGSAQCRRDAGPGTPNQQQIAAWPRSGACRFEPWRSGQRRHPTSSRPSARATWNRSGLRVEPVSATAGPRRPRPYPGYRPDVLAERDPTGET